MSQPEEDEPDTSANSVIIGGDLTGNVLQIGTVAGDVHYGAPGMAQSWYLGTVRDVAPGNLLGRTTELAELRRFCLDPDPAPAYAWWRAEAWSGKTALMSWFVLNPPKDVRVVSFLITARDTRADTRAGFLAEVVPQLAVVARVKSPEQASESDFRGLLDAAAKACSDGGRRLILVVDGLDEDRGAGEDHGAKSIAALLPRRPVHGLRVIVSGRPNPGIPPVLPDDHPLRDPAIVRELAPSPAAIAAKYAMKQDLDRLLGADAGEAKDVLGLLVAARSGLSRRDLGELVGGTRISEVLDSVESRAFSRRHARWRPEFTPEVYLLGHQGLYAEAADRLGEQAVRTYGEQITRWAESYRVRGWPPETPQFLLHGYPRLLQETGQHDRLVECVTDLARQSRLIEVTGGEAGVQAEVAEVQAVICNSSEPDVVSLVKITMQSDDLRDRNARTPARLPVLWARMGDFDRAEALARSISSENRRGEAVGELLAVMVEAGLTDRADRLVAESLPEAQHPYLRAQLAGAIARTGDFARARSMAEDMADPDWRAQAALAVAAAEGPEDVEVLLTIAGRIGDGILRQEAIHSVAQYLLKAGFAESAIELSSVLVSMYRFGLIAQAARVLLSSGATSKAQRVMSRLDDESARKLWARLELEETARTDLESAVAGLATIEEHHRESVLLKILEIAIEDDNVGFADFALSGLGSHYDELGLHTVLKHLSFKGELERAEALLLTKSPGLESERDFAARAGAFTAMAEGALLSGDFDATRMLAERAEAIARRVGGSYLYSDALRSFADFVTTTKNVEAAERLAGVLLTSDPAYVDSEQVARFLAESGDVKVAESLAFRLGDPTEVLRTLVPLLRRLRTRDESAEIIRIVERAEGLAGGRIDEIDVRCVVEFLCAAGVPDRALERADALASGRVREQAQSQVVEELCAMGRIDDAVGIVRRGRSVDWVEYELTETLAKALGAAGRDDGLEILNDLGVKSGSMARAFLEELAGRDGERALELTLTLLDDFDKESALLAIAGRIDGPLRSRVLAEYLRRGDWARVLPLLNPVEQSGLTDVVDQFVALQEARLGLGSEDA
ncbi:hypothetical protein [Amycolatopsis plumensis]|uniref:NACHT domain-containing protein n=1 Tax=Amycolatopsis plumensis TaxID=236508 RepID=A0ABV5U8Q7_9PSEU